jgi:hypothetical protein
MKKTSFPIALAWSLLGFLVILPPSTGPSAADIYRWEDESGTIHFTDTPSNIPEKYRSRKKTVLHGPPDSGRPGLSNVGPAPSSPAGPVEPPPSAEPVPARPENTSGQADQLRARIAAKERFIEGIDRKRSNILNPMGNRFVSQEDLELYKKYSEELPQDRQRLKEMASGRP